MLVGDQCSERSVVGGGSSSSLANTIKIFWLSWRSICENIFSSNLADNNDIDRLIDFAEQDTIAITCNLMFCYSSKTLSHYIRQVFIFLKYDTIHLCLRRSPVVYLCSK